MTWWGNMYEWECWSITRWTTLVHLLSFFLTAVMNPVISPSQSSHLISSDSILYSFPWTFIIFHLLARSSTASGDNETTVERRLIYFHEYELWDGQGWEWCLELTGNGVCVPVRVRLQSLSIFMEHGRTFWYHVHSITQQALLCTALHCFPQSIYNWVGNCFIMDFLFLVSLFSI